MLKCTVYFGGPFSVLVLLLLAIVGDAVHDVVNVLRAPQEDWSPNVESCRHDIQDRLRSVRRLTPASFNNMCLK